MDSQLLLAQTSPKSETKKASENVVSVPEFLLSNADLDKVRLGLGSLRLSENPKEILGLIYGGMKAGADKNESGSIGIKYLYNRELTKSPAEVLSTKKGDCDEITRLAYLVASESGVKNIAMVEMSWFNPKTKELEGHAALVLMPEKAGEKPLVFDFTYLYNGETLESDNLDNALMVKYEKDAKNPNFEIRKMNSLSEVEASYYDKVGEYHTQRKKWETAERAYEKATKLVPENFKYNWNLAVTCEKQNKHDSAIAYYKKCANLDEGRNNPQIYAALGSSYCMVGQYVLCIATLEKALTLNPGVKLRDGIKQNLVVAYMNLTAELEKQKKYEDAEKARQKAKLYK